MINLRKQNQSAATLIELVIAIPVVLAVIFFIISLSLALNAKFSLHSAMGNAVRLAFTRSDVYRLGMDGHNVLFQNSPNPPNVGMLPKVHAWYEGQSPSFSNMPEGFWKGIDQNELENNMKNLVFEYFDDNTNLSPKDVPISYYYTLFYTYQAMESSIGGSLKYPCPTEQPWCLLCQFHHPEIQAALNTPYLGPFPLTNTETIHFRCRIRPWGGIFNTVFNLLGSGGGENAHGLEISARVHASR
jgi:hypothetical protein